MNHYQIDFQNIKRKPLTIRIHANHVTLSLNKKQALFLANQLLQTEANLKLLKAKVKL